MPGTATVSIGQKEWAVDVAAAPSELAAGLGGIESIPSQTGMLFDLGSPQTVEVTTEPMLFNIDIIFISEDLEVVDIVQDVAPGYLVTEDTPVRFFLEVNAGEAEGVEAGDSVEITDYEYTAPDTISQWMPTITSIAMLGFVGAMFGGMASSMFAGDAAKSKKYLPEGAKYTKTGMMITEHHSSSSSSGKPDKLKQTTRESYFWTAVNKDIGEIAENTTPYTSVDRALREGKAYVSRRWTGIALVEIWTKPYRYSENLKLEPLVSETVNLKSGNPGEFEKAFKALTPKQQEILLKTNATIASRTTYGMRVEKVEQLPVHELMWSNASAAWGIIRAFPPRPIDPRHIPAEYGLYKLLGRPIRIGDEVQLDANEVLAYGSVADIEAVLPLLDPLPLYRYSTEAGMRGFGTFPPPETKHWTWPALYEREGGGNPGNPAATVTCPVCGKILEVPQWNKVSRSDVLLKHLEKEHKHNPSEEEEIWQMTQAEWLRHSEAETIKAGFEWSERSIESQKRLHWQQVRYALAAGLPVPSKVLADYPDLHEHNPGQYQVRFVGHCKVVDGLCHTHGYSVSREVRCPDSELTKEEWQAAWDLAHEAFPEGQHNPWVNGWWPETMREAEKAAEEYRWHMRQAIENYKRRMEKAAYHYERSGEKAIAKYRQYVLKEYERGKALSTTVS